MGSLQTLPKCGLPLACSFTDHMIAASSTKIAWRLPAFAASSTDGPPASGRFQAL
ncbi:MAG TPA: hypothetical protein VGM56_20620 [Byssovorax sp.]